MNDFLDDFIYWFLHTLNTVICGLGPLVSAALLDASTNDHRYMWLIALYIVTFPFGRAAYNWIENQYYMEEGDDDYFDDDYRI
jgi:hypothetical protein